MAVIHWKGSAGNDANDGSTWSLADATLAAAATAAGSAGGTVYADSAQTESTGANVSINGGVFDNPLRLISGTPGASTGLTTVAKGAAITVSGGTFTLTFNDWMYVDGLVATAGASTQNCSIVLAANARSRQFFKDSDLIIGGSSSSARITIGASSTNDGMFADWQNVGVRFAAATQYVNVWNAELRWEGGSVLPGGTSPTSLFGPGSSPGRGTKITMTGVDLTNLSSGFHFANSPAGWFDLLVRGCKLPAGWSGNLVNAASANGANYRAVMIDCDTANSGYIRFKVQDDKGQCEQETTTTRTGSGDGISDYSIKITGTSRAKFPGHAFVTHEQAVWNSVTGVSRKLTIEVAAGAALTNQDIVVRARYYGDATSPQMSLVTSQGSPIASAAALTTSAASWNGSPSNKYKVELTFTPQRAGYVVWEVLSFTTTPVFVDPKPTLANA